MNLLITMLYRHPIVRYGSLAMWLLISTLQATDQPLTIKTLESFKPQTIAEAQAICQGKNLVIFFGSENISMEIFIVNAGFVKTDKEEEGPGVDVDNLIGSEYYHPFVVEVTQATNEHKGIVYLFVPDYQRSLHFQGWRLGNHVFSFAFLQASLSFIEACIASCDTVKAMVPCFRWNALGEQTGQVRGQRPWMRLRRFLDCVLYNVPDYMPPLYNKNKQLNSEEIAMYGNIFWLFHIPQEVYLWKLPGDPVRLLNLMIEYELVIRDVHTPRGAVSHDIQERLLRQISYESENWTMYQDEYPVLKASNLQQITKVHLDKSPRFDVVYSSKKYYPNKLKNTLHPFFQKGSDDLTVSK